MREIKGKRLLLLGSNNWEDDIRQFAIENSIYLIFAGLYPGALDSIADEHYRIDTTDPSVMIPFIKERNIDGVFMGGSELIISKSCDYINQLGYPCYCTKNQWDLLQDKKAFKDLCKKYKVPTVPEYGIDDKLSEKDFPVIVKPVDGSGSRGITVCYTLEELERAKKQALEDSPSKRIIIEKYINNGGLTNMVKYVAIDGHYYLEAMGDRYVLNKGLITANTFYPSKYIDFWVNNNNDLVCKMLRDGVGLKNGVIAFQTIPDGDNLYVYECCFRLTGGRTYKMTEATSGNNSMKMLLCHALTGKMCVPEEVKQINPFFNGRFGSSMAIPLREGTIASIDGKDVIMEMETVIDYIQYYEVGDTISHKCLNTLDQLFARIMVVGDEKKDVFSVLNDIRDTLFIKDTEGKDMILWDTFDKIYNDFITENKF